MRYAKIVRYQLDVFSDRGSDSPDTVKALAIVVSGIIASMRGNNTVVCGQGCIGAAS